MRGRLLTLDALSWATVGLFLFFAPHIVADFLFVSHSFITYQALPSSLSAEEDSSADLVPQPCPSVGD